MLGKNHAALAAFGWLAAAPAVAAHLGAPLNTEQLAVGALVCAGAGVFPDIDHPDATVARSFGLAGRAAAVGINVAAGGHRQRTHTIWFAALAGIATNAAVAAGPRPAGIVAGLCVALAAGLLGPSLGFHVPLWARVAWGVAAAYLVAGPVPAGGWMTGAVVAGCLLHLVGDILTPEGVPLLWPLHGRVRVPLFHTGGIIERLVGLALLAGLVLLSLPVASSLLHAGATSPAALGH